MCKKLMLLMIFASLLVWTGNAIGATRTWDHGGADKLWKTAANWSSDTAPTSADDARILDTGVDKPVIDSTHTGASAAKCSNLQIGYNTGETGEVSMTGGNLTCYSKLLVGYSGNGTFTMSGGSISIPTYDLDIGAAAGGTGSEFHISGGTVNIARYLYVGHLSSGTLDINGGSIKATSYNTIIGQAASGTGIIDIAAGTLNATGQLIRVGYNTQGIIHMTGGKILAGDVHIPYSDSYSGHGDVNLYGGSIETAQFWMGNNGYLDIEEGKLIIDGDVTSTINSYVSAGKIRGYGGVGTVEVTYNTPYAGKTTVRATQIAIENSVYQVIQHANLATISVINKSSNTTLYFTPKFTVIYNATRPTLSSTSDLYAVWTSAGENPFGTGTNTTLSPTDAEIVDGNIVWTYPTQTNFDLSASMDVSTDYNEPMLRYTLTAKTAGWFMLAYTGAPEVDPNTMEILNQPTMWTSKPIDPPDCSPPAFPTSPKFAQEYLSPMSLVMTRNSGKDCAVIVSPEIESFRLPHYKNVEFGLCIRNLNGKAQPLIFSPEMGAQDINLPTDKDSYLAVNDTFSFSVLWAVDNSEWSDFYKGIVKNVYKVRDLRDNTGPGSLNKLLANLTDYALDADGNNYNMWDSNQKCNEYWTDDPCAYKMMNGLFAINSAIVLDNNDMFWSRALPQMEYALSRQTAVFTP